MNERFKELRHEASLWCDANIPDQWDEEVGYGIAWQDKFAELIVQECAGICDQQGRAGWNDDRKAQARLDRDLIKEHFGVE